MLRFLSRRQFIGGVTAAGVGCTLGLGTAAANGRVLSNDDEDLLDWSAWEHYRATVKHPCLTLREADLEVARQNIRRYGWARAYAASVESNARRYLTLITPAFLENMIEDTTPGDPLWTPCPSCRDQHKPVHPHGLWTWNVENPDQLHCDMCGAVFPNDRYPEEIVLHTQWGKAQTIRYCGGETFPIFSYKNGRPSFTANIRSRKVQWMAHYCRTLAEAYFLTGDPAYAVSSKNILLRFAECYPSWLVHVGYGEYADMDPRIAAQAMDNLPEPELCPPPNEPDHRLWTGFWSAGRATGVGLESDFVRKVVEAYDLTCSGKHTTGTSVYTESEKKTIERNLLLESTILLVSDKSINNKAVSNRTAVALVGMCVGHPGLVRFGLEGFHKTVDGWYLSDGTSSETPFYGLMTLGGIWDMAQSARGYSDPPGYRDRKGNRIDALDLYHHSHYDRVWDAFFRGLQGDLYFPPYGDSFRSTRLDTAYVELMVANYPERTQYLALLKEQCGPDLSGHSGSVNDDNSLAGSNTDDEAVLVLPYGLTKPTGYASFSCYYRAPGLEEKASPALTLPDWCPEKLRIGHLRTGDHGRESLLVMNASHWGNHHELDSLNLYYWKKGCEVLSDLGYLWDHPLKPQNKRTLAHNTVVIDEEDQGQEERGGQVLFFKTFEHVKVMEMASQAYQQATLYRRTSAVIDHGGGRSYVLDFFRVEGGQKQDYVFHAADRTCEVHDLTLRPLTGRALYDFKNVRSADGATVWRTTWKSGAHLNCVAWSVGQPGEQVFVADGWGQRDWKNTDLGATIPYVVRRCEGAGQKTFISVFEGFEGTEPFVRNVRLIDQEGVVEVETALGTDFILSRAASGTFNIGAGKNDLQLSGHFAATSLQNNQEVWNVTLPEVH